MKALIPYLPLVGCLAMMLFMCGPMLFKRHQHSDSATVESVPDPNELAELREEVAILKAQIVLSDSNSRGK